MDIDSAPAVATPSSSRQIRDAKQELWQARFALSTRQLKDYSTIPAGAPNHRPAPDRAVRAPQPARPDRVRTDGNRECNPQSATATATPTGAPTQGKRKTKVGRVVSDKMDKTIVVSIERLQRHPLYKRVIRLTTKFKAHDEHNEAHVGDTVLIEESRPLSATKRWRLVEVVARAGEHGAAANEPVSEEDATRPRRSTGRASGPTAAPPRPTRTSSAAAEGVDDPAADPPQGRRQHGRAHDLSASGSWAARRRRRPAWAT